MAMDVVGIVVKTFPIESGQSNSGKDWTKALILIETQDQYPKKILFEDMSGKSGIDQFKEGDLIKVQFNLESREYNNRFYRSARAWRAELHTGQETDSRAIPPRQQQSVMPRSTNTQMNQQFMDDAEANDLPF